MTIIENSNEDTFNLFFLNSHKHQIYVDVGAYNGDTIDKALAINPLFKVVAIEPIKSLADAMQLRFQNNENINVINKACYNSSTQIRLNEYNGWSKGLSTINPYLTQLRPFPFFTDNISTYYVQADTLDNILSSKNIDRIDYLKIDVEGAEEQVLEGFTKYRKGTRFHIESHIINLENILYKLVEMNANIEKVTLFKDGNIKTHILGSIVGEFT